MGEHCNEIIDDIAICLPFDAAELYGYLRSKVSESRINLLAFAEWRNFVIYNNRNIVLN